MTPGTIPNISKEVRLVADRFRIERASYSLDDGRQVARDTIQHPGAVVILPILPDGRILLIQNFRLAIEQWLLELPAGTLEKDEPPIKTAERELIEETGYRCGRIEPLCDFYMSPGILREHMFAFLATDLQAGQSAPELGELMVNVPLTVQEIDNLIQSGKIIDSKTLSALLYYLRFRA